MKRRFLLNNLRYFSLNKNSYTNNATNNNRSVIVITGASSGIGEEIALKYSNNNNNLILCSRRIEKLQEVSKKCLLNGANQVQVIKCDVSNENDCQLLINETIKLYEKIDVLVLNAGIGQVYLSFYYFI